MTRNAQRLVGALLVAGPAVPAVASGQAAAGGQLWRVVTTTLPRPPALATGVTGAFWNPAQSELEARAAGSLELVQTPSAVGASALLAAVRVRVGRLGALGLLYGRVQLNDLVRTSQTPDPEPGSIPYYTQTAGVTWSRGLAGATLGATLALHETQVDALEQRRVTVDGGLTSGLGGRARFALATHSLRSAGGDPAQDLYAALEYRVWRRAAGAAGGPAGAAEVWARYGATMARGFAPDHLVGLGLTLGARFGADLMLGAEGGYAERGWRPVGGFRVGIGRYGLTFARDVGMRGLGSAYRVGLERRVP